MLTYGLADLKELLITHFQDEPPTVQLIYLSILILSFKMMITALMMMMMMMIMVTIIIIIYCIQIPNPKLISFPGSCCGTP